jgi:dTDP-4-dehydrorhamnose 3,5-epimerase/CDP-3, 6-dideoxy-D-glycero-D-glycero-4-hexulose-5-epimerase
MILYSSLGGIHFQLQESYFPISDTDVIRGMHFQLPPHQHSKIVFCPQGAILDVIIDLRKSSTQFGKCYSPILSAENHKGFYIPERFAHGFKSLCDNAITYYLVSSQYHQQSDIGIAFDSITFDWGCNQPITSVGNKKILNFNNLKALFNKKNH